MTERSIKSNKIGVGDISISYQIKKSVSTSSHTILFLHGFTFNMNKWRQQRRPLPEEVTRIAVDIRRHCLSTSGHGFVTINVFAKDMRVLMEKCRIENTIVCGFFRGGYIALR